ncbi:MAG: YaeQ family protein, partial [Zetaproteobacteria bacterium]|nr:YaeQ family protein [Zetaproteobacteria bacterium]
TYNYRTAMAWWEQMRSRLTRFDNLSIIVIPDEALQTMGSMAQRGMQLQYTIQDGEILVSNGEKSVTVEPETLLSS